MQECKQGYHLARGCELQSLVMLGREEVELQKYQAKDLRLWIVSNFCQFA